MRLVALLAALVVVTSAHEIERVTELGEDSEGLGAPSNGQMALEPTTSNGGDDTHPHGEDGEATGNFKAFLNNPGPRYGLPGYKESHNWEQGVDIFSPVIFDPLFYAAKYGLTQNTTDQVKLDWSTKGLSGESPGCRQATAMFSINKYANNHPQAAVVKATNGSDVKASCMQMTQHYLKVGMYEGWSGAVGFNINQGGATNEEPISDIEIKPGNADLTGNADVGKSSLRPELSYTYTFWMKIGALKSDVSNILEYTEDDAEKQPNMQLNLQAGSTNLEYKVAQSDFPDWSCAAVGDGVTDAKPGYLELSTLYFVALVTEKFHSSSSKIILYVDGVKACEKDNTAGTSIEPAENAKLFISGPGKNAADAELKMMKFFPDTVFTQDEVKARMTAETLEAKPPEDSLEEVQ